MPRKQSVWRGADMAFFDISLDTANELYSWGWRVSLGGAVVTAIGVSLLMWGTRVRDSDFEENIAKLHERAATSEERGHVLEKENLEMRAAMSRVVPRVLSRQFVSLLEGKPKSFAEIVFLGSDQDSHSLSLQLEIALSHNLSWSTARTSVKEMSKSGPTAGAAEWGISIVTNKGNAGLTESAIALGDALVRSLGERITPGLDKSLPDDRVRVVIFPPPNRL